MATEYISREAVIKTLRKAEKLYRKCMVSQVRADMIEHCIKLINDIPAADVQPVVMGEWIDKLKKHCGVTTVCSACGKRSGIGGIDSNRYKPFCPNCGAIMMGVQNDN